MRTMKLTKEIPFYEKELIFAIFFFLMDFTLLLVWIYPSDKCCHVTLHDSATSDIHVTSFQRMLRVLTSMAQNVILRTVQSCSLFW